MNWDFAVIAAFFSAGSAALVYAVTGRARKTAAMSGISLPGDGTGFLVAWIRRQP